MENGMSNNHEMKVEIPIPISISNPISNSESDQFGSGGSGSGTSPVLTRQPSGAKSSCLCSPTTHAGSFRCRLHRAPSLQRSKSNVDSAAANSGTSNQNNSVEAQ